MSKYDEFNLNLQGDTIESSIGPKSMTGLDCVTVTIVSYYNKSDCGTCKCTISKTKCETTLNSQTGCHFV